MGGFVPLAFIAVCLRLYTRWRFSNLGYDDLAVTVGFVSCVLDHASNQPSNRNPDFIHGLDYRHSLRCQVWPWPAHPGRTV